MADIFLSYSSEDRERVRPLVERLEEYGWSVWWDREIPPGQTWPQMIEGALSATKAMVVVWSEASVKSKWVQIEAAKGEQRGGLIPVAIDPVEAPLQFSLIQAADLTAWDHSADDQQLQKVIEQLERVLGVPTPTAGPIVEQEEMPTDTPDADAVDHTSASTAGTLPVADASSAPQVNKPTPTSVGDPPEPKRLIWVMPTLVFGLAVAAIVAGWQFWPSPSAPEVSDLIVAATVVEESDSALVIEVSYRYDTGRAYPPILGGQLFPMTSFPDGGYRPGGTEPGGVGVTVVQLFASGLSDARQASAFDIFMYDTDGEITRRRFPYVRDTVSDVRQPAAVAPRIEDFRASATSITEGDEVTLTWSTSDADRVELRPGGPVALSGSTALSPQETTDYVLAAYGPGGETRRSVRISVTAAEPVTVSAPTPPPGADDPLNRPVWIEGGTFQMGSDDGDDDERPVHQVTVSGFWIQEHEVTNGEFSQFDAGHQFPRGLERHPVVNFYAWQAGEYASSRGGSLPTEAQWEFAARGTAGRTYPWGEGAPTCQLAHSGGCDPRGTLPVMSRPDGATPEGVHGLAGNVAEWVTDRYGPYSSADATDPTGYSEPAELRVVKGGSFFRARFCEGDAPLSFCRSASYLLRASNRVALPVFGFPHVSIGFRVVWARAGGQD